MKEIIRSIVIFAGGVAVGVFGSRRYFQQMADKIVQEEVDSVREHLTSSDTVIYSEIDEKVLAYEKADAEMTEKVVKLMQDEGYFNDTHTVDLPEPNSEGHIFQISESEFYRENGFKKRHLIYWTDSYVIENEDGVPESIPRIFDELPIDEFEIDGCVYVRDMLIDTDYEFTCTSEHAEPEDE